MHKGNSPDEKKGKKASVGCVRETPDKNEGRTGCVRETPQINMKPAQDV